ncbi:hypothetical protein AwErysi_01670 [Erysipelotrichaceae bacterium]|nr:hypothetical protein AwErysi_01670 [Erysipelotrichaceae bacterium]
MNNYWQSELRKLVKDIIVTAVKIKKATILEDIETGLQGSRQYIVEAALSKFNPIWDRSLQNVVAILKKSKWMDFK